MKNNRHFPLSHHFVASCFDLRALEKTQFDEIGDSLTCQVEFLVIGSELNLVTAITTHRVLFGSNDATVLIFLSKTLRSRK